MSNPMRELFLIHRSWERAHADDSPRLTVCKVELANLRHQIILRAGWASCDCPTVRLRLELHADLVRLRREYGRKIDEIAMKFGVQQAMAAQEAVEKFVKAPCKAKAVIAVRQGQESRI